jgi:hypothetical protein
MISPLDRKLLRDLSRMQGQVVAVSSASGKKPGQRAHEKLGRMARLPSGA